MPIAVEYQKINKHGHTPGDPQGLSRQEFEDATIDGIPIGKEGLVQVIVFQRGKIAAVGSENSLIAPNDPSRKASKWLDDDVFEMDVKPGESVVLTHKSSGYKAIPKKFLLTVTNS